MTSKPIQDDYCASLEKRVEEYENKIANMAVIQENDLMFLAFAKDRYSNDDPIRSSEMEQFFKEPVPKSKSDLFKRRWSKRFTDLMDKPMECILVGVLCFALAFMSWGVYRMCVDSASKAHVAEMNAKIDVAMGFAGIVTDDSRRIRLTKFVADNNMKINEEDLYACIRNKKYDDIFYIADKKLSSDDILALMTKKVENEENH